MSDVAIIQPPFKATPRQDEAARNWRDGGVQQLLLSGAIRSGKSQAAGRLFVEEALTYPGVYAATRLTYRELADTTRRAFVQGDADLGPLIPPEAIARYAKSDEKVVLRNGSEIIFRSLDDPAKFLSLSLAGIFVDQAEELDPGKDGEHLYDTLRGRLSDPRGRRKLIAVCNPASTQHWLYRRLVQPSKRDSGAACVHFQMTDNPHLPAEYVEQMLATRTTRPHFFRTYVEGSWGSIEGAAFEEWSDSIHVCKWFRIPDHWLRFQSLDHGAANPTAVLAWAADEDGNLAIFDEYYSPGLVSAHAAEILRRRSRDHQPQSWEGYDEDGWKPQSSRIWADPSVKAEHGITDRFGQPASVQREYREHGLGLTLAWNDRAAGYARLLELIHVEPGRIAPPWSQVDKAVGGSPRLFVFDHCTNLIEQLKAAPVETDGPLAGKAIGAKWESAHGHSTAASRYGALSWQSPAKPLEDEESDPRKAFYLRRRRDRAEMRDRLNRSPDLAIEHEFGPMVEL